MTRNPLLILAAGFVAGAVVAGGIGIAAASGRTSHPSTPAAAALAAAAPQARAGLSIATSASADATAKPVPRGPKHDPRGLGRMTPPRRTMTRSVAAPAHPSRSRAASAPRTRRYSSRGMGARTSGPGRGSSGGSGSMMGR